MAYGVDYAWSHPSLSALKAAKVAFAARYLATDASKSLTKTEAAALAGVGIWSVVVWETIANRMLSGKAAGASDATKAQAQAAACGQPKDRPIYFAADFDATEAQQTQINAYLDGAASVLGRARVGIYGGYYPVKRALDAKKATFAWQTRAWSGGQWDPRAHIRQGAYVTVGGVQCDANTSMTVDYGQWMPGKTVNTSEDTDMQLADAVTIPAWVKTDWPKDTGLADGKIAVNTALASTYGHARATHDATTQILAQLKAQSAAITTLAGLVGKGVDTNAVVAAVEKAIADAVVHVEVTGTSQT
ncbi:glycoside hydrolase domain-containing protein [Streptomyces sp. DW26H14]|uniref:glycoside hydrolase domain-containing protein n=1 Tax=Streptomyces sp. DW26H14 TaxID=3435395 RepID=UPI00403D72C5